MATHFKKKAPAGGAGLHRTNTTYKPPFARGRKVRVCVCDCCVCSFKLCVRVSVCVLNMRLIHLLCHHGHASQFDACDVMRFICVYSGLKLARFHDAAVLQYAMRRDAAARSVA